MSVRATPDEIRAVEHLLAEAQALARKTGRSEDWQRVDRLEDQLDEMRNRGKRPMSRDVEVLKRMRAELIGLNPTSRWKTETDAIGDAISALEQQERRAALMDGPMCAYGCASPSFMEAARAHGWSGEHPTGGDDYVAFNRALQAGWKAHVAACPNHPQRKVEAEVATLKARVESLEAEVLHARGEVAAHSTVAEIAKARVAVLEALIRKDYRGEHPTRDGQQCLCLQCEIARERRRLGFPG